MEEDPHAAEDAEEEDAGSRRNDADISKVTDFVEQKELDATKASKAIENIAEEINVDREAELAREKELAAVKVEQADVDLVASEMELDSNAAERKLREHKGDVIATIVSLVQS